MADGAAGVRFRRLFGPLSMKEQVNRRRVELAYASIRLAKTPEK
jgi:hypothetical protein